MLSDWIFLRLSVFMRTVTHNVALNGARNFLIAHTAINANAQALLTNSVMRIPALARLHFFGGYAKYPILPEQTTGQSRVVATPSGPASNN